MANLKFIPISGTTSVTENCYIYEYGNDMIVVDCGVGFPESEMYGVDLVIPDFSYIRENAHKLRGIIISHAHEDHIGALPFLLKDIKAPIYATKLAAGFIEDKFADYKAKSIKVNVIDPTKDVITLGVFKITPFRICHSVPDSVGFAIDTPEGKAFHIPDYKFDWTPVDGRPFDIGKAALLASGGTLLLASDCLGSTTPGYTQSEKAIESRIEILSQVAQKQIFFTTISSNISRMQQAINVAKKMGRKVCFVGRSIDRKADIARGIGLLNYPADQVVSLKHAVKLPARQIMYIISGSYGQAGSALYRVAVKEHDSLSAGPGDVVIFSSDPAPPGSKQNVDFVVDRLIEDGCSVHYYDIQEDLHVSGHGSQEDIKMLFGLIKPKYYIPIGGTVRHMRGYKELAADMGAKEGDVLELAPGQTVEFSKGKVSMGKKIAVRPVLVDGLGIGDVGSVVLRDRQVLAKEGIAIVLIPFDSAAGKVLEDMEIISRGFVFEGKSGKLLEEGARKLKIKLESHQKLDSKMVRDITVGFLEPFFFTTTGRRPMILPVVVEI